MAVPASATVESHYYLALGDSLAQGVQPNTSGTSVETNQGYADVIYAAEKELDPSLKLRKLGCPGETTATMLHGGICTNYTSQEAAAITFLRHHASATTLVTLDIGANNVDGCLVNGVVNVPCIVQGEHEAARNLPKIVAKLQAAAPGVKIVAMNYYDPFLASYLAGSAQLAQTSIQLTQQFNGIIDSVYAADNVPVVDVEETVFDTADFNSTSDGFTYQGTPIPNDVGFICEWTWMCAPAPQGPNIHANQAGYQEIGDAFLETINPPSTPAPRAA